jgi:CubicO group peptidase (beta-lactamase class C family)
MRIPVILVIFFGATAAGTPQSGDAVKAADLEGARNVIREMMVSRSVPSIAISVVRNGRILWAEGFGWADREQHMPAAPHTMYQLDGLSSAITRVNLKEA